MFASTGSPFSPRPRGDVRAAPCDPTQEGLRVRSSMQAREATEDHALEAQRLPAGACPAYPNSRVAQCHGRIDRFRTPLAARPVDQQWHRGIHRSGRAVHNVLARSRVVAIIATSDRSDSLPDLIGSGRFRAPEAAQPTPLIRNLSQRGIPQVAAQKHGVFEILCESTRDRQPNR